MSPHFPCHPPGPSPSSLIWTMAAPSSPAPCLSSRSPTVHVQPENLSQNMALLRRALRDSHLTQKAPLTPPPPTGPTWLPPSPPSPSLSHPASPHKTSTACARLPFPALSPSNILYETPIHLVCLRPMVSVP